MYYNFLRICLAFVKSTQSMDDFFFTRTKHTKNADFFKFLQMVRFTLSYGTPRSSRVMLKLLNLFSSISNVFETFSSLQTTMKTVERTEF